MKRKYYSVKETAAGHQQRELQQSLCLLIERPSTKKNKTKRGHFPSVQRERERGLLAVSGDFGREVLDASSAAALTQNVAVQRVTASTLPFGGQQETTFLTNRHFSQLRVTLKEPL